VSARSYIYVKWIHKNPEDPVHLYSELDGDPQFEGKAISAEEFQRQWLKRR